MQREEEGQEEREEEGQEEREEEGQEEREEEGQEEREEKELQDIIVSKSNDAHVCANENSRRRFELVIDEGREKALANAYVRETMHALHVNPAEISHVDKPYIEVEMSTEDKQTVDVYVCQHFRARLDSRQDPDMPACHTKDASSSHDAVPGHGKALIQEIVRHELTEESVRHRLTGVSLSYESGDGVAAMCADDLHALNVKEHGGGASQNKTAWNSEKAVWKGPTCAPSSSTSRLMCRATPGMDPLYQELIQWMLDPSEIFLGERIAVGGFAEVFLAKLRGTLVAAKVLINQNSDEFLREICTLSKLRHPNLLLFMGFATQPRMTIVSEYMHKGSLYDFIAKEKKPLDTAFVAIAALSIGRGMAYLHSKKPYPILHLDLKSPNILIDAHWRIKIADFGLSKLQHKTLTSGMNNGTPEWMAPEILRAEEKISGTAADVYAYGVILWEMLTGQKPWEDLNPFQVVAAVAYRNQQLPRPPEPVGSAFIVDLCMKCLAANPLERPSFASIVEDLERHFVPQNEPMHKSLSHLTLPSATTSEDDVPQHFFHEDVSLPKDNVTPPRIVSDTQHSIRLISPFEN